MSVLTHRRNNVINSGVNRRSVYLFLQPPLRHVSQRPVILVRDRTGRRRMPLRVLDFCRINGHVPVIISHRLVLKGHLCLQHHMELHPEISLTKLLRDIILIR